MTIYSGFYEALSLLKDPAMTPSKLYEKWWSGDREMSSFPRLPTSFHDSVLSLKIRNEDNYSVQSVISRAVAVQHGEYLNVDHDKAIIQRMRTWYTSGWNWRQSKAIESYPRVGKIFRVYVPTVAKSNADLFSNLATNLDNEEIHYEMKTRRSYGVFHDNIVIWVNANNVLSCLGVIRETTKELSFLTTPPPLSLIIGGVGVCRHPLGGESVGAKFAEMIWTIVRSVGADNLKMGLERREINPLCPWRLEYGNFSPLEAFE